MYVNSVCGYSGSDFSINNSKTHLMAYLPHVPLWNQMWYLHTGLNTKGANEMFKDLINT